MEEEGSGCLGILFFAGLALLFLKEVIIPALLILLGLAAAIILLVGVLYLVATYPKTSLTVIFLPFWLPHLLIAAVVLGLARSRPVRRSFLATHELRRAIYLWLVIIPVGMGLVWFLVTGYFIYAPLFIDEVLALVFTSLLLGCYYLLYFKYPPKTPDWLMFAATETMLTFELRAQAIRRLTKWKAEYAANKGTLQAAFITLCISLLVVLVATSIT